MADTLREPVAGGCRWVRLSFAVALIFGIALQAQAAQRNLVILNWSEYMDPEVVERFEKTFDVNVTEVYFESDDLRDDMMLETGGQGYDLVLVNGIAVDKYRKRGWLAPVDEKMMPNLELIDGKYLEAFPGIRGYAVPYFWGTMGIAYRADLVSAPLTSWSDLLRPDESLRGRINMVEASRDVMGAALKALGYSMNSEQRAEIRAAEKLLMAQQPYVRSFNYLALDEGSALVKGDVVAAMMYSGDALMVQEYHPEIEYVVPREGGNLWVDYFVVIESSRNKALAWQFLNFINEPENAAQMAEYVYYATPNTAAHDLLPEDFLSDPVIYPSSEVMARSEFYKPLSPNANRWRNSAFSRVLPDR